MSSGFKNSDSNNLKSLHKDKHFDNHELEMEMGADLGGFDDGNFGLNEEERQYDIDLDEVKKAEDMVSRNFEKVKDAQKRPWELPRELGFDPGALADDVNIFKQSFSFARDFNNEMQSVKRILSRSTVYIKVFYLKCSLIE
jgi:hypothetical protein